MGDKCIVVALGALEDGAFVYLPDELVVAFDESIARELTMPSAVQSAGGEVVLQGFGGS